MTTRGSRRYGDDLARARTCAEPDRTSSPAPDSCRADHQLARKRPSRRRSPPRSRHPPAEARDRGAASPRRRPADQHRQRRRQRHLAAGAQGRVLLQARAGAREGEQSWYLCGDAPGGPRDGRGKQESAKLSGRRLCRSTRSTTSARPPSRSGCAPSSTSASYSRPRSRTLTARSRRSAATADRKSVV